MSTQQETYTRWTVIASGEGAGRIASEFFVRRDNPGIEDRVVIMNTNGSDLRNTLEQMESSRGTSEMEEHAIEFGTDAGAGNDFTDGQRLLKEDLDRIVAGIEDTVDSTDAFMHMTTLGGGTGNGSIPFLIRKLKEGLPYDDYSNWMGEAIHASLGVWPYADEPPQQHFNAICGLSRLLRNPDGTQNADMVILGDNTHIAEMEQDDPTRRPNEVVNNRLVNAFDLMIGAGREATGVIDVQDYVTVPSRIGAYHFTPAVAMGMNSQIYDLEFMFDQAAENAFVPMDASTTRAAFAIVRVPRSLYDSAGFTRHEVDATFSEWKQRRDIDAPGMSTVAPKEDGRTEVDVLLLLGGFDLDPLLDRSRDDFEKHKDRLSRGRQLGNDAISSERMRQIEENLDEYLRLLGD